MNMTPITYESSTYKNRTLEYRLKHGPLGVYIEHRKHNSQWWDIAYGQAMHTQEVWDTIKKEGTKVFGNPT